MSCVWLEDDMQEKSAAGYFLEILVVVVILGTLAAIAMPDISDMLNRGKEESHDTELHNIQTAVTEMLMESRTGVLVPVGPTSDMSQVLTSDTPPLVLADYLLNLEDEVVGSACNYTFGADGTVRQVSP
jgi:type II secretory pathway pseudopilin PulG